MPVLWLCLPCVTVGPDRVSSIVRKYVEVEWIIGREFWEFVSDDPNCLDEIYAIATEVARNSGINKARHSQKCWKPKFGSCSPNLKRSMVVVVRKCGRNGWT